MKPPCHGRTPKSATRWPPPSLRAKPAKDDLAKLTTGADQLASGLSQLDTTQRTALTPLPGLLNQAQTPASGFSNIAHCYNNSPPAAPVVDQALQSGPGLRPWPNKPPQRSA